MAMTRKRFIKIVMADGFDRNEANALADARPGSMTYAEWRSHYYVNAFWDKVELRNKLIARRAARRLRRLSGAFAKVGTSAAAFAKAAQDAMRKIADSENDDNTAPKKE